MIRPRSLRLAALVVLTLAGSSPFASAQGVGIKVGPTFDEFSGDVLNFDNRTGIHAGLFIGGSRDKVVGLQTEFNWLRKNTATEAGQEIRIDYLQVPVLFRVNAGSGSANGAALYGVVGPAFDFKIGDEVEGFTLDDGIEGTDVSLAFGGGFEVAHIIIEGRYEKGFRRINKTFSGLDEIKKQSFALLFGVRFK
jgi:opacity protein-like surface antigen